MKNIISTILSFSVLVVAGVGCCGLRQLPVQTSVRDSVAVRYKDSTVIRYVDVEVPVPVESSRAVVPDSSHLETSIAVSDASVDSLGRLHHSLSNKPGKLTAKVPFEEHILEKEETRTSEEQKTVTEYIEKPLTPWQTFRLRAFWLLLGMVAVYVLWKIARMYLHL